jgi:pyrimidine deaminase RibD-like protein
MKYIDLAIRIAKAGDAPRKPEENTGKNFLLGCVALRQDGAVVVSSNIRTQTPMHSAHAERRALSKSGLGATLWIARVDRDGIPCMAKPCKLCETLIINKRVKRVYYTVNEHECHVWNVS